MEISGWIIYLISIADGVSGAFLAITLLTGILGIILLFIRSCSDENLKPNEKVSFKKWIRTCIFLFFFFLVGTVAIPSSRALAAIYVIPKIVNNEILQEEAGELYKFVKEWLKFTLENKKEIVEKSVSK